MTGPVVASAEFAAMGTQARVDVVAGDGDGDALLEFARTRLSELEARWTRFRPDSELSRMNAHAGAPVVVSDDTFWALARAVDAWERTDGRYDPTVAPSLLQLGYDRTWAAVDADAAAPLSIRQFEPAPGCAGIHMLAGVPSVRLPAGVSVDLGGIGKGLAADRVVEELIARGAVGAHVTIGGDVRTAGRPPHGDAWQVVIEGPAGDDIAVSAFANGGAVATSGTSFRRFSDGRHHVIDPRTGAPAVTDLVQVSVVATDCGTAEVFATAALCAGSDAAVRLLSVSELAAVLVMVDMTVVWVSANRHDVVPGVLAPTS